MLQIQRLLLSAKAAVMGGCQLSVYPYFNGIRISLQRCFLSAVLAGNRIMICLKQDIVSTVYILIIKKIIYNLP